MFFWIKVLVSSVFIAGVSSLALKKPMLAGAVVVMPIISAMSLTWLYLESRDMQKVSDFAHIAFLSIPLAATFFIPFVANRWLKFNFISSAALGLIFMGVSYGVAYLVVRK